MTNTYDATQQAAAKAILLTAGRYTMEAFVQALADRGASYAQLYAADDGASITATLKESERVLVDAVAAIVQDGRDRGLRGTDVAPRIRDAALEHGARVAAEYLIARGMATS